MNRTQERLDEASTCLLADPAKSQTCDGNTELRCRDVRIKISGMFKTLTRASIVIQGTLLNPSASDRHQRELGREEKAISRDKKHGG